MSLNDLFEAEIVDTYRYRLSYGGQSPFFNGLAAGMLVASKCTGCSFVWMPMRPICSNCYEKAEPLVLANRAELLTSIVLPNAPAHLAHLDAPVASALVRIEDADTCMKVFVVMPDGDFRKGRQLVARFLPEVQTIADFYFTAHA